MSLPPKYFDDVYAANKDPWGFSTSPYETAKYDATLAALPRPRYHRAWEIGCSIGVLTQRLAERCDSLLATDVVEEALQQARERCANQRQVEFQRMALPQEAPEGAFDLIVLSEVGYYFHRQDLEKVRDLLLDRLPVSTVGQESSFTQTALEDGHLLLVHWTPHVPDYPMTGDEVHELFRETRGLRHLHEERHDRYRLDLFQRGSGKPEA